MKNAITLFMMFAFIGFNTDSTAQTKQNENTPKKENVKEEHGKRFVDKNGDGYNDNAPDHDGDGIPNGLDPDYKGAKMQRNKFVDLNGDGINDNAGKGMRKGIDSKGIGAKKGNGVKGLGIKDGSGTGRGYKGGNK